MRLRELCHRSEPAQRPIVATCTGWRGCPGFSGKFRGGRENRTMEDRELHGTGRKKPAELRGVCLSSPLGSSPPAEFRGYAFDLGDEFVTGAFLFYFRAGRSLPRCRGYGRQLTGFVYCQCRRRILSSLVRSERAELPLMEPVFLYLISPIFKSDP